MMTMTNPDSPTIKTALACAVFCLLAMPAHAQQMIRFSSGTGFFLNADGHIITNNHVVANCKATPRVRGAMAAMDAPVIATDPANDLALLKVAAVPVDYAHLRGDNPALAAGEELTVVGFPGQQGAQGVMVTQQAKLVQPYGPQGETKWVQFSNTVQQGNSGGPLLDSSGNVIGVIMAKSETFFINTTSARQEKVGEADVAISLQTLKPFLDANRVRYGSRDSLTYLSSHRVYDRARNFIVNVQCQQ